MDISYVAGRLWPGLVTTVHVTLWAGVLAVSLAFVAGLSRRSSTIAIRLPALLYIEFFRGTSALVQLFWLFFALPGLGINLSPFMVGVVGLGMNVGAYGAEVVRGAVDAIPKHQTEAAQALNLSETQTMINITIPQAVIVMIPPLTNLLITLLKGTSLVSLISLTDLTSEGMRIRDFTGYTIEIFAMLFAIYFALATVISRSGLALEKRLSRGRIMAKAS